MSPLVFRRCGFESVVDGAHPLFRFQVLPSLLFIAALLALQGSPALGVAEQVDPAECASLERMASTIMMFYLADSSPLEWPPANTSTAYTTDGCNPCTWRGVRCCAVASGVTPGAASASASDAAADAPSFTHTVCKINLMGAMLGGTLSIDSSVDLPALAILDLSFNMLGGALPSNILHHPSLERLLLYGNPVTEPLPDMAVPNSSPFQEINLASAVLSCPLPNSLLCFARRGVKVTLPENLCIKLPDAPLALPKLSVPFKSGSAFTVEYVVYNNTEITDHLGNPALGFILNIEPSAARKYTAKEVRAAVATYEETGEVILHGETDLRPIEMCDDPTRALGLDVVETGYDASKGASFTKYSVTVTDLDPDSLVLAKVLPVFPAGVQDPCTHFLTSLCTLMSHFLQTTNGLPKVPVPAAVLGVEAAAAQLALGAFSSDPADANGFPMQGIAVDVLDGSHPAEVVHDPFAEASPEPVVVLSSFTLPLPSRVNITSQELLPKLPENSIVTLVIAPANSVGKGPSVRTVVHTCATNQLSLPFHGLAGTVQQVTAQVVDPDSVVLSKTYSQESFCLSCPFPKSCNGSPKCQGGHAGPACAMCKAGHSMSTLMSSCVSCSAIAVASVVFLAVVLTIGIKVSRQRKPTAVWGVLQVAFNSFQALQLVLSSNAVPFPSVAVNIRRAGQILDTSVVFSALQCIVGFDQIWLAKYIAIGWIFPIVALALHRLASVKMRTMHINPTTGMPMDSPVYRILGKVSMGSLLFMFLDIVRTHTEPFECFTAHGEDRFLYHAETTCYDTKHTILRIASLVFLLLVGALLAALLWKFRAAAESSGRSLSTLTWMYIPTCNWFAAIVLTRKMALTIFSRPIFPGWLQASLMLLINAAYFAGLVVKRPYVSFLRKFRLIRTPINIFTFQDRVLSGLIFAVSGLVFLGAVGVPQDWILAGISLALALLIAVSFVWAGMLIDAQSNRGFSDANVVATGKALTAEIQRFEVLMTKYADSGDYTNALECKMQLDVLRQKNQRQSLSVTLMFQGRRISVDDEVTKDPAPSGSPSSASTPKVGRPVSNKIAPADLVVVKPRSERAQGLAASRLAQSQASSDSIESENSATHLNPSASSALESPKAVVKAESKKALDATLGAVSIASSTTAILGGVSRDSAALFQQRPASAEGTPKSGPGVSSQHTAELDEELTAADKHAENLFFSRKVLTPFLRSSSNRRVTEDVVVRNRLIAINEELSAFVSGMLSSWQNASTDLKSLYALLERCAAKCDATVQQTIKECTEKELFQGLLMTEPRELRGESYLQAAVLGYCDGFLVAADKKLLNGMPDVSRGQALSAEDFMNAVETRITRGQVAAFVVGELIKFFEANHWDVLQLRAVMKEYLSVASPDACLLHIAQLMEESVTRVKNVLSHVALSSPSSRISLLENAKAAVRSALMQIQAVPAAIAHVKAQPNAAAKRSGRFGASLSMPTSSGSSSSSCVAPEPSAQSTSTVLGTSAGTLVAVGTTDSPSHALSPSGGKKRRKNRRPQGASGVMRRLSVSRGRRPSLLTISPREIEKMNKDMLGMNKHREVYLATIESSAGHLKAVWGSVLQLVNAQVNPGSLRGLPMGLLDKYAGSLRDVYERNPTSNAMTWVRRCEQAAKARADHQKAIAKYILLALVGVALIGGAIFLTVSALSPSSAASPPPKIDLRQCTPAPESPGGYCGSTDYPVWETYTSLYQLGMSTADAVVGAAAFYPVSFGMNRFKPECVIFAQKLLCDIPRAPCNATACSYVKPCVSSCFNMIQACSNSNSPTEAVGAFYFLLERTSRPTFLLETISAEVDPMVSMRAQIMAKLMYLCHPALYDYDPMCDFKPPQDHKAEWFQEAANTCGTRLTEASLAAEAAAAGSG